MRDKILLIEDDLGLALPLKDFFEDSGINVLFAPTGEQGVSLYKERSPDLIVLDVKLPGMSGFDVIAEIKKYDQEIPVIMMTGTEIDPQSQIKGYQSGAITYMEKPVIPAALLALIKTLLSLPSELKSFKLGECRIRIHSQSVEINDAQHHVREKDALLLTFLLNRRNQIVPRSALLNQIWHDDHPDNNNLLDTAISRVRQLFKQNPYVQIKNVYGEGYMLSLKRG